MATLPNQPSGLPKLPYRDDPNIPETFVDSLHLAIFDGAMMRWEFTIQRYEEPRPPKPPTGHAKTAARLVMPAPLLVTMYNQLANVMAILAKQGLVTLQGAPPTPATLKTPPTVQ